MNFTFFDAGTELEYIRAHVSQIADTLQLVADDIDTERETAHSADLLQTSRLSRYYSCTWLINQELGANIKELDAMMPTESGPVTPDCFAVRSELAGTTA